MRSNKDEEAQSGLERPRPRRGRPRAPRAAELRLGWEGRSFEVGAPRPPAPSITLDETSDAYPVFQHAGYEFIYMLSGEVTYRHADRSYLMQPGDSLFFDAEAPHGPEELRRLPARYLSIIVSLPGG